MKKILFSSCMLAACLTACNNEDVLNEMPAQNVTEEASVVGADLVSHGMKININGNEASTRVDNAGNWEKNDQVGLAWYNFKKDGNITETQDKNFWDQNKFGEDLKLYANHIFTVENVNGVDQFTTMTDVYQGAYFVYFPYERLGGVNAKTIAFNEASQKEDFLTERNNKAFRISTQDFISANEAVGPNNELEKSFALKMVVNPLKVDVTPSDGVKGNNYFDNATITKLRIFAGGNANEAPEKPFITEATLNPNGLPKVVRDEKGDIDYGKSYEAIFDAAKNQKFLKDIKADASLTTKVENAGFTLSDVRSVRAFVYPLNSLVTYSSLNDYPRAYVTVCKTQGNNTWNVGEFVVNNINSKGFAEKLRSYLSDGQNGIKTAEKQLDEILHTNNIVGVLGMTGDNAANLNLSGFTPNLVIESVAQWNDMVAFYNSLDESTIKLLEPRWQKPRFTWAGTETFKGEIKAPTNVEVQLATDKPLVIEAGTNGKAVEWPVNLKTDVDALITVKENTTLNVGMANPSQEVIIGAQLTNKGVINAGPKASIGKKDVGSLYNEGRIYVTYGAYVYPNKERIGEIAYIVKDNDAKTINKIEVLVKGGKKESANVNTLIIEGTSLDLNAKGDNSSTDDRYEGSSSTNHAMPDLRNVAIELNNGTIVYNVNGEDKTNTLVKSVKTVGGEYNSMIDVQIYKGNITTEQGTTLEINSVTLPEKTRIEGIDTILNEGTLNANTNILTKNIDNTKGTITVDTGYAITYTTKYLQGGTVNGTVNKGK